MAKRSSCGSGNSRSMFFLGKGASALQAGAVFFIEGDIMNKGRGVLIFLMNVAGIIVVTIILAPLVMPIVEFLLPIVPGLPRLLCTHLYPDGYDYAKDWYNILQFVTMGFLVFNVRPLWFTSLSSLGLRFQPGWRLLLWQGFFWALIGYMIIICR